MRRPAVCLPEMAPDCCPQKSRRATLIAYATERRSRSRKPTNRESGPRLSVRVRNVRRHRWWRFRHSVDVSMRVVIGRTVVRNVLQGPETLQEKCPQLANHLAGDQQTAAAGLRFEKVWILHPCCIL